MLFKSCSKVVAGVMMLQMASCGGCLTREDEPVQVGSQTLTFETAEKQQPQKSVAPAQNQPRVRVINIGPSKNTEGRQQQADSNQEVPSEVVVDTTLTSRLKERLAEAFEGRGSTPPEVDIYTGSMSIDGFAKYYEDRGFKIQRTSVPASQVIAPLLDEKPELSDKIMLSNYAGIVINQVIVEGANISAADKYIDPETYEVVYKTFVTVTHLK